VCMHSHCGHAVPLLGGSKREANHYPTKNRYGHWHGSIGIKTKSSVRIALNIHG